MLNMYDEDILNVVKGSSLKDAIIKTGLSQSKVSKIRAELKSNGVELFDSRKVKKDVVVSKDYLKDAKATSLKDFLSIVSNVDQLNKLGYGAYMKLLEIKIKDSQDEVMDFEHYLQLKRDVITDARKVYVADRIAEIRIGRELVKSELEFVKNNATFFREIQSTLSNSKKFIDGKKNRKYKVRRLVRELGDNLTDEIGANVIPKSVVIEEVKGVKTLAIDNQSNIIKQFDEEVLKLRKHNLKLTRKERVGTDKMLMIDKLVDGYYNNFKQLNAQTRNKLVSHAEQLYADSDENKLFVLTRDFVIKNFLLPKAIFDKKEMKLIKKEYWNELV